MQTIKRRVLSREQLAAIRLRSQDPWSGAPIERKGKELSITDRTYAALDNAQDDVEALLGHIDALSDLGIR